VVIVSLQYHLSLTPTAVRDRVQVIMVTKQKEGINDER